MRLHIHRGFGVKFFIVLNHTGRLLASDAFQYASSKLRTQTIAILANLDIAFDDSLNKLLEDGIDLK